MLLHIHRSAKLAPHCFANSSISRLVYFFPAVPDDPPQDFEVIVLNSTGILLTWTQPSIPNGIITSYTVAYNLTELNDVTVVLGSEVFIYVALELNEDTFYRFQIHASTRIGPGPTNQSTVKTDESCKEAK